MKKTLLLAACTLVISQACTKEEDISKLAMQALDYKYPYAEAVTWQIKSNYVVAEFFNTEGNDARHETNAWFDNSGIWYMTETDILFNELPDAVKTAFAASQYAEWRVDDVDKVERNNMDDIFIIEVENDNTEMGLYFSADGILVKEMADVDKNYDYYDFIPTQPISNIVTFISTNYPSARIFEVDIDGMYTEVEILDGKVCRELIFDVQGNWLLEKTDIRIANVPPSILQVLQTSEFASYFIDEIEYRKTAEAEYYRFELESAAGDVTIDISTNGVLTIVEKETGQGNYVGNLNQTYVDFISSNYIGAVILESEYEHGYLEVEIFHEAKEKIVRFNASNVWVDTHWDIRKTDLPSAVNTALNNSKYSKYRIDDVEYYQTPSGDYYLLELEKGFKDVTIRIKADGNIF